MTPGTRGYWVEACGRGAIRAVELAEPTGDSVLLRAIHSGISPGTERLVGCGRVPAGLDAAMAVPGMLGSFALPVLYGYAFVGAVERGDALAAGTRVFTMQPHQQHAVVPAARCVPLPDAVPSARAVLFANLETARNAVWDAMLAGTERVLVVGAGAVGLLVHHVLAAEHRGPIVLAEADTTRAAFAAALPWRPAVAAPADVSHGAFDVAVHASGSPAGLQLAIDAVGFEGRVVDLSWYGDRPVTLDLGSSFHHQRKALLASQVGAVARPFRAAGHAARTAAVLALLHDARLDALLAPAIPFASLPTFFHRLYRAEPVPPCPLVGYG